MSSRGTDEGSGRKRPAEKEALAMAIWWEVIEGSAHWEGVRNARKAPKLIISAITRAIARDLGGAPLTTAAFLDSAITNLGATKA